MTPANPTPAAPPVPADNPFRAAARIIVEVNRHALEVLKDR